MEMSDIRGKCRWRTNYGVVIVGRIFFFTPTTALSYDFHDILTKNVRYNFAILRKRIVTYIVILLI